MRYPPLIILLVSFSLTKLFAQGPLEGAWEMVSIKGVGAEGEVFNIDTTTAREIKVITPTHYFLIAHNVEADSLIFNRSYFGEIQLDGNAYVEKPLYSSLPIFDNVKTDFTWRLEDGKFIQAGTFTRPDGKTIILEKLVFRRIIPDHHHANNPAIGTWRLMSLKENDKIRPRDEQDASWYIVTPTHLVRFHTKNGKFENAVVGAYAIEKDNIYLSPLASSITSSTGNVAWKQKMDSGRLIISSVIKSSDGTARSLEEIYERVK